MPDERSHRGKLDRSRFCREGLDGACRPQESWQGTQGAAAAARHRASASVAPGGRQPAPAHRRQKGRAAEQHGDVGIDEGHAPRLCTARFPQHLPGLGGGAHQLPQPCRREGTRAYHRPQGRGGLPPWRPVREASSADGRLVPILCPASSQGRRHRHAASSPEGAGMKKKAESLLVRGNKAISITTPTTGEQIEKARAELAAKCLRELVVAAEKRTDPATWALSGGHEAEDFLECIENGRWHPLLRIWNERNATVAANRPAPTMLDLIARRFIIILCAALERTGLRKGEARKFAAEAVAVQGNAFPDLPSAETIHRWQRNQPPLTAVDERWITTASAPLVCSARAAMDR